MRSEPEIEHRSSVFQMHAALELLHSADNLDPQALLSAIDAYEVLLLTRPDDPEAYLRLAACWLYFKQPEKALIFSKQALDLDPFNPTAQSLHGSITQQIAISFNSERIL